MRVRGKTRWRYPAARSDAEILDERDG